MTETEFNEKIAEINSCKNSNDLIHLMYRERESPGSDIPVFDATWIPSSEDEKVQGEYHRKITLAVMEKARQFKMVSGSIPKHFKAQNRFSKFFARVRAAFK